MALTFLHAHAMQTPWTPNTPTRLAESRSSGALVRCVTTKDGPTTKTTASMFLPSVVAPGATNHWESKQFTLAQPAPDWQLGNWFYFDGVDVPSGQNPVLFYQTMRNSLPDMGLELRYNASGHALHLMNANGTSVDSDVNSFLDATWAWVEAYSAEAVVTILVNGLVVLTASSDFVGATSGFTQASMYFDGQTDSTVGAGTAVYVAQGYFADGSSGTDDLVTTVANPRKFECTAYRLGATSSKADESDIDGNGDALSGGALVDTADDTVATNANYIGTSGSDPIGATWAMDEPSDDGPAPHFNKWETCLCMKFMFYTSGGTGGGTRTLRYGWHSRDTASWGTSSIAVGNRIKYTEVFGLPGVGLFPTCPHSLMVAAVGWYIHSVINTFQMREAYFWVFGYEAEGNGSYFMKHKPVTEQIGVGLVGDGAGRVG